MKKIAFKTLGCRLNQFETESLASRFYRSGYKIVDFNDQADVYLINTCTVTGQSDKKSENYINKVAKRKGNPILLVTGCMVNHPDQKLSHNENITYLIDNEHKSSIFEFLEAHFKGELYPLDTLERDVFNYEYTEKIFHTRSTVKIQDGCNNFCSFCIIPMVRGRAISRPPTAILDNIKTNIDQGYKEVTLTGVNMSRYQFEQTDFTKLVERILQINGDFRLRISSLEPDNLNERFIDLFDDPKLCPHLHLCLQSGSDKILLQMHRMYTVDSYMDTINCFRSKYSDFNFTTDIMVGFPGETQKDFNDTCKLAKEVGFSHIHTFKYSIRNGTRAARMTNQIPEEIKTKRSNIIREISDENKRMYRTRFIGKSQVILPEKINKTGLIAGYGQHYIPVRFKQQNMNSMSFQEVEIRNMDQNSLILEGWFSKSGD